MRVLFTLALMLTAASAAAPPEHDPRIVIAIVDTGINAIVALKPASSSYGSVPVSRRRPTGVAADGRAL